VFRAVGVPGEDAELAADVLVRSDERGIDSHGVARLPTYVTALQRGATNAAPKVEVVHETPSTATVDGDNGLGLVVGPTANRIAMRKAAEVGSGWVAVRRSNHFGIAGWYVLEAVSRDLIGWSMTNATGIVAPLGGATPRIGTNPIAVGIPSGEEPPFVLDMATSAVAHGKMEIAMRAGTAVPDGWAIDAEGRSTTDPAAVLLGGALVPLGGDHAHGGHKGYGLAGVVDLLCGPLSGAAWGPFTPNFTVVDRPPHDPHGDGIGHFFGAMRVDGFGPLAEIKARVDDWIRTMRSSPPLAGEEVLVAGDPERVAEADRRVHGIPLVGDVVAGLRAVGDRVGVAFG